MATRPRTWLGVMVLAALLGGTSAYAQQADNRDSVSREEHEKLKEEFEAFKAQTGELLQQRVQETPSEPDDASQEYLEFLDQQLQDVRRMVETAQAGSTKFLLTGYATAGFTDREGDNSTFGTTFNPIFLWQLNDRLLFEGELEIELESEGETEVNLEYAHFSYLANDYITVGAGKFLTPFGIFPERLHPAWINKLPDAPLAFEHHGGMSPTTSLGAYIRGGYPIPAGEMKGNYAFYVSNGPSLNTEGHHAGELDFENSEDIDNNKAVGGRIGILPVPELELGYSFQYARISPEDFDTVDVILHAIDLSYVRESDELGGVIDVRAEWVLSDVEDAVFEGHDGPFTFDNKRKGGYAQIAYRPSKNTNNIMKNLEGVFRYDWVDHPDEVSSDRQRYTIGLNYWFASSAVLKLAYQIDDRDNGGTDTDAFLIQTAIGF